MTSLSGASHAAADHDDGGAVPAARTELRPILGPVNLTLLGVSNAIGAGIFVLTGVAAAQHAGPAIALSFVIAGAVCLLTALCYAELAVLIPSAGGSYAYAARAFGPFTAWIVGWCMVLEYLVAGATVAVGWSAYAVRGLANLGIAVPKVLAGSPLIVGADQRLHWSAGGMNLPAVLIVLFCTLVLARGLRGSAMLNGTMVAIKIFVILLVVVVGAFYVDPSNWQPFVPENEGSFGRFGWSGVLTGAAVAFFAFTGFESMSISAREARNPSRDLPIALLAALATCAILYIAMSLTITGLAPYRSLDVASPVSVAIAAAGPGLGWLEAVINAGTILGLGSAVLVSLYGQSRIFYAMAEDRQLPAFFGAVHARYRTPAAGTLVIGMIAALIAGLFPIDLLGELVSMGCLIAFGSVCAAVIQLRSAMPGQRSFPVPLYPWVPALGIVSCAGLAFSLPAVTWRYIGTWILLGAILFPVARLTFARRARP